MREGIPHGRREDSCIRVDFQVCGLLSAGVVWSGYGAELGMPFGVGDIVGWKFDEGGERERG